MKVDEKSSWLGNPKAWEVTLMVATGACTIGVLVWLLGAGEQAKKDHEVKMQKIDSWKESMVATSTTATVALRRLQSFDLDILALRHSESAEYDSGLERTGANWNFRKFRRCVELLPLLPDRQTRQDLVGVLEKNTGAKHGDDAAAWATYYWKEQGQHVEPDPTYPDFKAILYRGVDPRFVEYFSSSGFSAVNLSEVLWDGVSSDSSSMLEEPFLKSAEAALCSDGDIVYGIDIAGDAHALPEKLLAGHKVLSDSLGGREIVAVYSPSDHKITAFDRKYARGTLSLRFSGFRYRSDDLLFDEQTKSLWQSSDGSAITGLFAQKQNRLKPVPVVTTTWGHWKTSHPKTKVVTGFKTEF